MCFFTLARSTVPPPSQVKMLSKPLFVVLLVTTTAPGLNSLPLPYIDPENYHEVYLRKTFDPVIINKGHPGMERIHMPDDPCVHKRLDAKYKEETGFKSPYEVIVAGNELPSFPSDYKSCHMIAGTKRWPSKPPPGPWYKRIPSTAYDYFKKTLHIVDTVTPEDHPARMEAEAHLNDISTNLKDRIGMAPIDWRAPHAMPENHPSALETAPQPQPIDGVPPPGPPDVGWFWPANTWIRPWKQKFAPPDIEDDVGGMGTMQVESIPVEDDGDAWPESIPLPESDDADLQGYPAVSEQQGPPAPFPPNPPYYSSSHLQSEPVPIPLSNDDNPGEELLAEPHSQRGSPAPFPQNPIYNPNVESPENAYPNAASGTTYTPPLSPKAQAAPLQPPNGPTVIDLPAAHQPPPPLKDAEGNEIFEVSTDPKHPSTPLPSGQEAIHELSAESVSPAQVPPPGPIAPEQVGYHFRGYDPVKMYAQPSESGGEDHESVDERLLAQPALLQGEQASQPHLVHPGETLIRDSPHGALLEHPKTRPLTNAADFILPEPKTDEQLAQEEDYISQVYKQPITRRPATLESGYWQPESEEEARAMRQILDEQARRIEENERRKAQQAEEMKFAQHLPPPVPEWPTKSIIHHPQSNRDEGRIEMLKFTFRPDGEWYRKWLQAGGTDEELRPILKAQAFYNREWIEPRLKELQEGRRPGGKYYQYPRPAPPVKGPKPEKAFAAPQPAPAPAPAPEVVEKDQGMKVESIPVDRYGEAHRRIADEHYHNAVNVGKFLPKWFGGS